MFTLLTILSVISLVTSFLTLAETALSVFGILASIAPFVLIPILIFFLAPVVIFLVVCGFIVLLILSFIPAIPISIFAPPMQELSAHLTALAAQAGLW